MARPLLPANADSHAQSRVGTAAPGCPVAQRATVICVGRTLLSAKKSRSFAPSFAVLEGGLLSSKV